MTRSRITRTAALAAVSAVALSLPNLAQAATVTTALAPAARPTVLGGDTNAVPAAGDNAADLSFDSRATLRSLTPTAAQRAGLARLPGAVATWNPTGTPRSIGVDGGFLSAPRSGDPLAIARGWLATHRATFGLGAADVADLAVVRNHTLPGIDTRVVSFAQTFGGVAAGIGGILTVVVDRQGRVVSYAGDPVRSSALLGSFELTPAQALTRVVDSLVPGQDFVARTTGTVKGGYEVFEGSVLGPDQLVRKVAFPTAQGGRAAYAVLSILSLDQAWATIVDAATGEPLLRKSLVQHEGDGSVFENYPGAAKGGKQVVKSFGPTATSPGGYLDPTGLVGLPGITTLGNNANTAIAWTVPLVAADQYNRPVSPTGTFRYPFTNSWEKSGGSVTGYQADANAAATNLFYHHNRIHDEYYAFGFTESGGNFQLVNKPGTSGLGGDPVFGGAQSGALNLTEAVLALGRNNANMLTLPDGIPGFTNMYLWEFVDDVFEGPNRDGDFDSTIIQHEYSHGLSNRYVGGGGLGSLGTTQSGAMGEGWGDWFAMNDLFRRGLTRTAVTAPYVGDPQRGIRNWNYAKSPATYGDYGYDMSGPEVHSDGEIWTATLWTLRTKLLQAVGGNQKQASDVAEHLVMDAMPLSPPSPSMLDMRDAIVKAGQLRYGKKYADLVWDAFAERGFGVSAKTDGETDTDPRPGFDVKKKSLNGTLKLTVVNDSAGGRVKGVRVLGGRFEGRGTPVFTTGKQGTGQARFAAGRYTLTLQAPGFGIQRVTVAVAKGRTTATTIRLRPNLLSRASGATVVGTASQASAFPAENLLDDSEATGWRTGTSTRAYNKGPDRSVTVKLKKPSTIRTVAVSVIKPIGVPRFAAAKKVLVQTSMDGRKWRTVKVARFSFAAPRPAVSDLGLKTYQLGRKGVRARFVRAVAAEVFGSGATNASTAVVAEVQAFGTAPGIKPRLPKPDKPVTYSGSVAVGNPAQGSLLGLDPYRPGATELTWTCPGLPTANGGDAHFARLPKGAGDGQHVANLSADVPLGEYMLYFYDESCAPLAGGGFVLDGESVVIPPGAVYSGFLLIYGTAASYTIEVTEPR
ncbi:M36 family metallopeptidase [Nocardioides sp.]|uniref:M36 family metallopeptidase n=1 Tax=Nocardioides sp. TaxID=35761 RepID=UPI00272685D0|nr:M36 family metallopeptidase [Nocardioides sp.]MDO9456497.1 M36 family metallopeptidase [Nocardioides sp.]